LSHLFPSVLEKDLARCLQSLGTWTQIYRLSVWHIHARYYRTKPCTNNN